MYLNLEAHKTLHAKISSSAGETVAGVKPEESAQMKITPLTLAG